MNVEFENKLIIKISGSEVERLVAEHVDRLMDERGFKAFHRGGETFESFPDTEWHSCEPPRSMLEKKQ